MKTMHFNELACRYFPFSTKRSATTQLKRWMKENPELLKRLEILHYQPRQRVLTPLQYEAFITYLGEPGS